MEDLRKSVNEYLFYELGMELEEDASKASKTWPFELREVGNSSSEDGASRDCSPRQEGSRTWA